jgi:hypothetical protein
MVNEIDEDGNGKMFDHIREGAPARGIWIDHNLTYSHAIRG